MEFKVGVGKSDFEALRKSNDYYVDKTDIIYELVEETGNQVTLFTERALYYARAESPEQDLKRRDYWYESKRKAAYRH